MANQKVGGGVRRKVWPLESSVSGIKIGSLLGWRLFFITMQKMTFVSFG